MKEKQIKRVKLTAKNSHVLAYLKKYLSENQYKEVSWEVNNGESGGYEGALGYDDGTIQFKGTIPLSGLFLWSETRRGREYWNGVYKEVMIKLDQEENL
jgi:hypothetical protein